MNSAHPAATVAVGSVTSLVALVTASVTCRRLGRCPRPLACSSFLLAHAIGTAVFCVLFIQWFTHGRQWTIPLLAQASCLNATQLILQGHRRRTPETRLFFAANLTCGVAFVVTSAIARSYWSSFLLQPLTLVLSGSGIWSAWSFRSPLRAALMSPRCNGVWFLVTSYTLLACHGLFVLAPLAALFEDVVSSYLAVFWLTLPANAFLTCCRAYGVFWHSNRGRVYLEERGAVFNKQLSREAESGCWDVAGPEKGAV
ncbi:hypothetical protein CGCFRS4_v015986 [Colletotrichum fructicola]|nr:hypothetical protein CGCFRS4_v015986 [Colletotrichum fructicola]